MAAHVFVEEPSLPPPKPFQTLDRPLDIPVRGLDSVVHDGPSAYIATSGYVTRGAPGQRVSPESGCTHVPPHVLPFSAVLSGAQQAGAQRVASAQGIRPPRQPLVCHAS
jgi:hypothetical protein